jgi:hypothetical protein
MTGVPMDGTRTAGKMRVTTAWVKTGRVPTVFFLVFLPWKCSS